MRNLSVIIFFATIINAQIDTLVTINASSYSNWIYYSLDSHSIVDIENPENSLEWDLAFQRKHIKTNSGLSGIGNGGAYVDSSLVWNQEWDNDELPDEMFFAVDTTLNDFYDFATHTFGEGIKNPALNAWGWFDDNYHLNVTNYVFYVLASDGINIVKFWPQNYYNQTNQGGYVQLRYQTGFQYDSECDSLVGDVNNDFLINVVDVVQIVSYVLGNNDFTSCQIISSDFNQDNLVNVVDIVNLVSFILS